MLDLRAMHIIDAQPLNPKFNVFLEALVGDLDFTHATTKPLCPLAMQRIKTLNDKVKRTLNGVCWLGLSIGLIDVHRCTAWI